MLFVLCAAEARRTAARMKSSIALIAALLLCCVAQVRCSVGMQRVLASAHYERQASSTGHRTRGVALEEILLTTGAGDLRGISDGVVDEFLGIPFAAPPLGPLRFRAPQPPAPWSGIWDATYLRTQCVQTAQQPIQQPDTEDCLYLNIVRPSGSKPGSRLPVMVYIHGGGYVVGGTGMYETDAFVADAERDVIAVTIPYRLGPFGFATFEGLEAEYNAGFLDQRMALKWVYDNIEAFGGDHNRITIYGESAGGGSVAAHVAMNNSWPYFHRAILESAVWWTEPISKGLDITADVGRVAGCVDKSMPALLECMQSVPVDALRQLAGPVHGHPDMPMHIHTTWEKGAGKDVPVIFGVNENEGALFTRIVLAGVRGELTDEEFDLGVSSLIPEEERSFVYELYAGERKSLGNRAALDHAASDYLFCGYWAAQNGTLLTKSPMYRYLFTQPNPLNGKPPTHFTEVQYVFARVPPRIASQGDVKVSHAMIQWWVSMAETGDPNEFTSMPVAWPPYSPEERVETILDIKESPRLIRSDNSFYCGAWYEELYHP